MTKFKFWIMMLLIFSFVNLVACNKEEDDYEWHLLTSQEYYMMQEITVDYYENFDESMKIYSEVLSHFKTIDGEYTDDFGGVFIDSDGLLNVLVIGSRKPVELDYLIYQQAENSFNALLSIFDEASKVVRDYTIWKVALCVSSNIVLIGLEDDSAISLIVDHLNDKQLYNKDAIAFYVGEPTIQLE